MSSRIFDEAVAAYDAQDYRTAIKSFRRLAIQGDALAQCRLGLMYYEGLGTKQNYDKAYAWMNLSATQGFSEAMEVRELLKELILKVESRKPIDAGDPIVERAQHDRRSKTNRREVTDLRYFARGGSQRRSFKDRRVTPERRSVV